MEGEREVIEESPLEEVFQVDLERERHLELLEGKDYRGTISLIAINKGSREVTIRWGKGREGASHLDRVLLSFVLESMKGRRFNSSPGYFLDIDTGEDSHIFPWRFNQSAWVKSAEKIYVSIDNERLFKPIPQKDYFVFQNCCKEKKRSAKIMFFRWGEEKKLITCNIGPTVSHTGNGIFTYCNCVIAQCLEDGRVVHVIQRRWKKKEEAFLFFVLRDDGIYIQDEAFWDDKS